MSFNLGGSRQTQKETGSVNNELDPWVKDLIGGNVRRAQGVANTPFQPYGAPRVAGMNPTQMAGRNMAFRAVGLGQVPTAPMPSMDPPDRPTPRADPVERMGAGAMTFMPSMDSVMDEPVGQPIYQPPRSKTLSLEDMMSGSPGGQLQTAMQNGPGETPWPDQVGPVTAEPPPPDGWTLPTQPAQPYAPPNWRPKTLTMEDMITGYGQQPMDLTMGQPVGAGALQMGVNAASRAGAYRPEMIRAPTAYAALGNASQAGAVERFDPQQGWKEQAAPYQLGVAPTMGMAGGGAAQAFSYSLGDAPLVGATQAMEQQAGGYQLGRGPRMTATLAERQSVGDASQAGVRQIDRGAIRDLDGGFIRDLISSYQDPYESQVVDAALGDVDRARRMMINDQSGGFTKAGAFGGSRQGIADAETNRAALGQGAATAAQLRSAGFTQAASLAQADLARRLQAQSANQGADLSVASQNQRDALEVDLANSAQRQNQSQFGLTLQQQLSMANAGFQNDASARNLAMEGQYGLALAEGQAGQERFNAGQRQQMQLANAAANDRANAQNQALLGQFALSRAEGQAGQERFNAGQRQGMEQFNLNAQNDASARNLGVAAQYGLAAAEGQAGQERFNAGQRQSMDQFNAGQRQQAAMFGAGAANDRAESNAGRRQQMDMANLGSLNQFGLGNQDAAMRALLANQQAGLSGAGINLQGAGLLGQFGAQQRSNALGDASVIMGLGQQEQGVQQAALDAAFEQYQQQMNSPLLMQQLLNQSLGLVPTVVDSRSTGNRTGTGFNAGITGKFVNSGSG